jgi:hypothetical protein
MCNYKETGEEWLPYHNDRDTHQCKQLATLLVMFAGDFDGSPTELVQILGGTYPWISTPIRTTYMSTYRFLSLPLRPLLPPPSVRDA